MTRLDKVIATLLFTCTMVCRADVGTYRLDPRAGEIRSDIAQLPSAFRPADQDIHITSLDDKDMNEMAHQAGLQPSDEHRLLGIYWNRQPGQAPEIYIRRSLKIVDPTYTFQGTVWHEYAHWLYFEVLNDDERAQYKAVWAHEKKHVTPYAGTNEFEGFAEAFRLYMEHPDQQFFIERNLINRVKQRLTPSPTRGWDEGFSL